MLVCDINTRKTDTHPLFDDLASMLPTHSRDTGQEPTPGREEELRLRAVVMETACVLTGRAGPPRRLGSVTGVPQLQGGPEEGPGGESGKDKNLQVLCVFSSMWDLKYTAKDHMTKQKMSHGYREQTSGYRRG